MKKFYLDEREVIALYEQTHSTTKVADHYGCYPEAIRRILIANNIPRHKRKEQKPKKTGFVLTKENEARIVALYKRFGLYGDVAKCIGCSTTTVRKVITEHGLNPGYGGTKLKITDEQLIEECKVLTRTQIAEKYDMHVASLDRRMGKLGVHAQYSDQNGNSVFSHKHIVKDWHWTDSGNELVKKHQPDYEFISYKKGRYRIKCKKCGGVIERARSTIAEKNLRCDHCAEEKAKQEEWQRLINALKNVIDSKTPKTCESCGSIFYSPYATQKYCSDRCKRKKSNSSNGYRGRAKKYKVPYVPGITLKAVANRDKGICQLCGKPVDWSDNTWGDSFGAMYPTIDHIVAMANGGGHTWDNVQLAHAICNSYKRDLSENEEISTAVLEGVKLMGKEAQYAEIQTA